MELRRRRRTVAAARAEAAMDDDDDAAMTMSEDDQPVPRRKRGKAKAVIESESETEVKAEVEVAVEDEEMEERQEVEEDEEAVDTRRRHKAKNLATARSRAVFYARYNANNAQIYAQPRRQQVRFDEDEAMGDGAAADDGDGDGDAPPKIVEPPPPKIIDWNPSRSWEVEDVPRKPASLYSMCVELLGKNVDFAETLEGVPEAMRQCITQKLYELSKITISAARLITTGPVSQLLLPDCTKITEQEFAELLQNTSLGEIEDLELGFCGRVLCDEMLHRFAFPRLRKLRLHGNYRITDGAIRALLRSSSRGLKDVELSDCCCLTESVVQELGTFHGPFVQTLSLDGCTAINGTKALPYLLRLPELRALSLVSVTDVTDEVISELMVAKGAQLEELSISYCKVTDRGMAAVGACGAALKSLHLERLELTDVSLQHLAENCKTLSSLSLDHGDYSDEALADFVTAAGSRLRNLSLASIKKAGDKTLVALAKYSAQTLETLNASFCRRVTEDGLGFLADACPNLAEVRLFGCTQVTDRFIKGHSNKSLKLVGERNGQMPWRMTIKEVFV